MDSTFADITTFQIKLESATIVAMPCKRGFKKEVVTLLISTQRARMDTRLRSWRERALQLGMAEENGIVFLPKLGI